MLLFVETIVSSCRASSSFSFPPYKSFSSVLQKFLFRLTKVSLQAYKCFFYCLTFYVAGAATYVPSPATYVPRPATCVAGAAI